MSATNAIRNQTLTKKEWGLLKKAVDAACPFHLSTGDYCLHYTLGKIQGMLLLHDE